MITRYIEPTEATEYLSLFHSDDHEWFSATDQEKTLYLNRATRTLNNLPWKGVKGDTANAFPRENQTEIPDAIKFACAEIAFTLAEGVDPAIEFDNLVVTSQKIGTVSITSDVRIPRAFVAAGVLSLEAWRLILPYLRYLGSVSLERV